MLPSSNSPLSPESEDGQGVKSGRSPNRFSGPLPTKKNRRACTECHRAKARCLFSEVNQSKCDRCFRMNKECVPHLSRQGKRKKKPDADAMTADCAAAPAHRLALDEEKTSGMESGNGSSYQSHLLATIIESLKNNSGSTAGLGNSFNFETLMGQMNPLNIQQSHSLNSSSQLFLPSHGEGYSNAGPNPDPHVSFRLNQEKRANPTTTGTSNFPYTSSFNADQATSLLLLGQYNSQNNDSLGGLAATANSTNSMTSAIGSGMHDDALTRLVKQVQLQEEQQRHQDLQVHQFHRGLPQKAFARSKRDELHDLHQSINHFLSELSRPTEANQADISFPSSTSEPSSQNESQPQDSSRLKKQKKAHLLPEMNAAVGDDVSFGGSIGTESDSLKNISDIKSNSKSDNENGIGELDDMSFASIKSKRGKKLKRSKPDFASEESPLQQPQIPPPRQEPTSNDTVNLNRNASPEDIIGTNIVHSCLKNTQASLKNHYGLNCLIREWISIALAQRSFGLLGTASFLAEECGIDMDRLLCGVDNETETELNLRNDVNLNVKSDHNGGHNNNDTKHSRRKLATCTKPCVGRRMSYLLAMLLEPRHQDTSGHERRMLSPRLNANLLPHVAFESCSRIEELDVGNRWIMIRETHCGVTQFYCSPKFQSNVMRWSHVSQIYENNMADLYSLIFDTREYRRVLNCVAHQVALHYNETTSPRPIHTPKTNIRLLGRKWGESDVTTELIDEVTRGDVRTLEVDLLFVSLQTMDKHTYYMEFFKPPGLEENDTNAGNLKMRPVTPEFSIPPSYSEVMELDDFVATEILTGKKSSALLRRV